MGVLTPYGYACDDVSDTSWILDVRANLRPHFSSRFKAIDGTTVTFDRTEIHLTDYNFPSGNWAHGTTTGDHTRVTAAMRWLSSGFSDTFLERNWDRWLGMGAPKGRYRCPGAMLQALSRWRDDGAQELANATVLKRALRDTLNETATAPLDDAALDGLIASMRAFADEVGIRLDDPAEHAPRVWRPNIGRMSVTHPLWSWFDDAHSGIIPSILDQLASDRSPPVKTTSQPDVHRPFVWPLDLSPARSARGWFEQLLVVAGQTGFDAIETEAGVKLNEATIPEVADRISLGGLGVPETWRGAYREAADRLDEADLGDIPMNFWPDTGIPFLQVQFPAVQAVSALLGAYGTDGKSFGMLSDALRDAADSEVLLHEAVARLIFGLKETTEELERLVKPLLDVLHKFDKRVSDDGLSTEVATGLPTSTLETLASLTSPTYTFDLLWPTTSAPPVFHLPSSVLSFTFEGFATRDFHNADLPDGTVYAHAGWLRRAWPSIQLGDLLDLGAKLYELGLYADGPWFLSNWLATSSGSLGAELREENEDVDALSEILRRPGNSTGLPLARLVAFLWRQAVVDHVAATLAADHGLEFRCAAEPFRQMRGTQRDRLDRILGPVSTVKDSNGWYWRTGGGILDQLFRSSSIAGLRDRWRALAPLVDDDGECFDPHQDWWDFLGMVTGDGASERDEWMRTKAKDLTTDLVVDDPGI